MGGVSLAGVREAFPRTFPVPPVFGFCEWSILYRHSSSEPRPDWALRTCSWIYGAHTKGSECKSHALAHMTLCKQNKEKSVLPDPLFSSVLAEPFSSFPAHLLQHLSTLIFISDFTTHTEKHKSVKTSLILIRLHIVAQDVYCSADLFYRGKCLTE